MNISKENIDELNAILTIEFDKADYEPKVEKAIKDYGKRVAIKGFRPGHAPVAMVKKFYGKSILVDQINSLVGETLSNYIKDNNIDILGEPLPNKDQQPIDFDADLDKISFKFDLGLSPEVNVAIDNSLKVPAYTISIDESNIDEQVKDIASRHGSHVPTDAATQDSLLKGVVTVGEFKNEKGLLSVTVIKDDEQKALFVGKKAGDTVEFDLHKVCPEAKEVEYLLEISEEQAASIAADAKATIAISEVSEFKPAELNEEFFKMLYPGGNVADEAAFRAKVKEQIEASNKMAEDFRFNVDARQAIMNAAGDVKLPEEFLKRWLTIVNKDNDKFTPDVLTNEFPKFVNDLKWQVVKNHVAKALEVKIEFQDVLDFAKKTARAQFMQYGLTNVPEEQLEQYGRNMLQNEEQRNHLAEGAVEEKLFAVVKNNASIEQKTVSHEDFGKLFANNN